MKKKKYRWKWHKQTLYKLSLNSMYLSLSNCTHAQHIPTMLNGKWACGLAGWLFAGDRIVLGGILFVVVTDSLQNPLQSWFSCHYYQCSGHMILFFVENGRYIAFNSSQRLIDFLILLLTCSLPFNPAHFAPTKVAAELITLFFLGSVWTRETEWEIDLFNRLTLKFKSWLVLCSHREKGLLLCCMIYVHTKFFLKRISFQPYLESIFCCCFAWFKLSFHPVLMYSPDWLNKIPFI